MRLQYASASVWTFRTRPADAAAIASSRSLMPWSPRPALTSARPSRLTANTSRSPAPVALAIDRALRACSIRSSSFSACRARSTATQPWPAHVPVPSTMRSARASQPRAADVRPPIRCWWDTQTASRAASSQPPSRAYPSTACSRAAMASRTSPRNQRASPRPSSASGDSFVGERGFERAPSLLPARRLECVPPRVEPAPERHVHQGHILQVWSCTPLRQSRRGREAAPFRGLRAIGILLPQNPDLAPARMGREGIEPSTLGLRVPCSTS